MYLSVLLYAQSNPFSPFGARLSSSLLSPGTVPYATDITIGDPSQTSGFMGLGSGERSDPPARPPYRGREETKLRSKAILSSQAWGDLSRQISSRCESRFWWAFDCLARSKSSPVCISILNVNGSVIDM